MAANQSLATIRRGFDQRMELPQDSLAFGASAEYAETACRVSSAGQPVQLGLPGIDLFHILDPRQFDRTLLDDLCALTTRLCQHAKSRLGARSL